MTQSDQDYEHGGYDGGVLDDLSGYLFVWDVMDLLDVHLGYMRALQTEGSGKGYGP